MRYIYYCGNCGYVGSDEGAINSLNCPECYNKLLATHMLRDEWKSKSDNEKSLQKRVWKESWERERNLPDNPVYSINGARGRHVDVYQDRCVITVNFTLGSFLTNNSTDGRKTIYYIDCIGLQFKKSGWTIGYLQLETASGMMNNKSSNFFNENSFTWDGSDINELMEEVANYIQGRIEEYKFKKNTEAIYPAPAQLSPADEIKKYKELLDMDIITQEEFDAKKKQLLGL